MLLVGMQNSVAVLQNSLVPLRPASPRPPALAQAPAAPWPQPRGIPSSEQGVSLCPSCPPPQPPTGHRNHFMPAPLKMGHSWALAPLGALCLPCLAVLRRRKCLTRRKSVRTAPDHHFPRCRPTPPSNRPRWCLWPVGCRNRLHPADRGIPGRESCLLLSWSPAGMYAVSVTTRKASHGWPRGGAAGVGGGRSATVHLL